MNKCFPFLLLIFCFLLMSTNVLSQKKTTVYFEGLGNGFAIGSINFDYRIGANDRGIGFRAGFSYGESANFLGMINYLIGANKHKIEFGVGVLNFYDRDQLQLLSGDIGKGVKPTLNISYRYHADNRLMLKAGWTPFIIDGSDILYTWLGAGIGWRL